MPIFEFYCPVCHVIFSFFSRAVSNTRIPTCPRCRKRPLEKQLSRFAVTGRAVEKKDIGADGPSLDDARMEKAVEALAGEAEHINEDDPRAAAQMMRKFSNMTGMRMGPAMEEALNRVESGEDPESIDADLGERLTAEEPAMSGEKAPLRARRRAAPARDETLYDL